MTISVLANNKKGFHPVSHAFRTDTKARFENISPHPGFFISEEKIFLATSLFCQVMITITHLTQIRKVPAYAIVASN
jgi:hypothetical protein